jgi:hypothetical protein
MMVSGLDELVTHSRWVEAIYLHAQQGGANHWRCGQANDASSGCFPLYRLGHDLLYEGATPIETAGKDNVEGQVGDTKLPANA